MIKQIIEQIIQYKRFSLSEDADLTFLKMEVSRNIYYYKKYE